LREASLRKREVVSDMPYVRITWQQQQQHPQQQQQQQTG
jgi:hypothetical protein